MRTGKWLFCSRLLWKMAIFIVTTSEFSHDIKMVDLSSSLFQRLPEGKNVESMDSDLGFWVNWITNSLQPSEAWKHALYCKGNHPQDSLLSGFPQMDWLKGKFEPESPRLNWKIDDFR